MTRCRRPARGPELDVRLLVDHRERLVGQRTRLINDLRWQLHDMWPEFEISARALITARWTTAATASSTARCTASPSPRGRFDPESADYLARKQAEGKSRREALRRLKRHLARRIWRLLQSVTGPSVAIGERPPVIAGAGLTLNCSAPFNAYSLT